MPIRDQSPSILPDSEIKHSLHKIKANQLKILDKLKIDQQHTFRPSHQHSRPLYSIQSSQIHQNHRTDAEWELKLLKNQLEQYWLQIQLESTVKTASINLLQHNIEFGLSHLGACFKRIKSSVSSLDRKLNLRRLAPEQTNLISQSVISAQNELQVMNNIKFIQSEPCRQRPQQPIKQTLESLGAFIRSEATHKVQLIRELREARHLLDKSKDKYAAIEEAVSETICSNLYQSQNITMLKNRCSELVKQMTKISTDSSSKREQINIFLRNYPNQRNEGIQFTKAVQNQVKGHNGERELFLEVSSSKQYTNLNRQKSIVDQSKHQTYLGEGELAQRRELVRQKSQQLAHMHLKLEEMVKARPFGQEIQHLWKIREIELNKITYIIAEAKKIVFAEPAKLSDSIGGNN